jgi:hypothetical protein
LSTVLGASSGRRAEELTTAPKAVSSSTTSETAVAVEPETHSTAEQGSTGRWRAVYADPVPGTAPVSVEGSWVGGRRASCRNRSTPGRRHST